MSPFRILLFLVLQLALASHLSAQISIVTPAASSTVGVNAMVSGTTTAGSSVSVLRGTTLLCTTTASASGAWSCTGLTFATGPQSLTARRALTGVTNLTTVAFTVAELVEICANGIDDDGNGLADNADPRGCQSNSLCSGSLGAPFVNVTYGTGTGYTSASLAAPGTTTTYTFVNDGCPSDGFYAVGSTTNIVSATAGCFGNSWHIVRQDHTGGVNGRFNIINAAPSVGQFYAQSISGLCGNTTYQFSAWIMNLLKFGICPGNGGNGDMPNLTFQIRTTAGVLIATFNTGNIVANTSPIWVAQGLTFRTGANVTAVNLSIINNQLVGSCGNDFALDDITFSPCGAMVAATSVGGSTSFCPGASSLTLTASVGPGYINPVYQWQTSADNGTTWADISGQTSLTTVIGPLINNQQYRMLSAEMGNIGLASCRVNSNPIITTGSTTSATVSIAASGGGQFSCSITSITLTASSPTPGLTYVWDVGTTGPSLTITNSDTYTVTARDANRCTYTATRSVLGKPPQLCGRVGYLKI